MKTFGRWLDWELAEKTLFGGSEHGRTKQKQLGHRGDGSIGIKVRH